MGMRFGTWNVRSLFKAGSLKTVTSKLAKYNLGLVPVQEVRCVKGGSEPAYDYTFFCGNENTDHHLGTGFFLCVHKGILSAGKRIIISDGISYIKLSCCWCDISVLNAQAPTEDKSDDMNVSFYKELECVFSQITRYHMKILSRVVNTKVGGGERERIFSNQ
jgi:hypothetical protein